MYVHVRILRCILIDNGGLPLCFFHLSTDKSDSVEEVGFTQVIRGKRIPDLDDWHSNLLHHISWWVA